VAILLDDPQPYAALITRASQDDGFCKHAIRSTHNRKDLRD
jgi:hypothetical protein